jgi:hypothetical protein
MKVQVRSVNQGPFKMWEVLDAQYEPPRKLRTMDIKTELQPDGYWSAIDADTYDVDCDQDGFFSRSDVGYGKTEQEAVDDLYRLFSERADWEGSK